MRHDAEGTYPDCTRPSWLDSFRAVAAASAVWPGRRWRGARAVLPRQHLSHRIECVLSRRILAVSAVCPPQHAAVASLPHLPNPCWHAAGPPTRLSAGRRTHITFRIWTHTHAHKHAVDNGKL